MVPGYRVYSPVAIGQLQFIRRAKLLGLSLSDIQQLFATAKAEAWGAFRSQVVQLLDGKLAICTRQIAELQALQASLQKRRDLAARASSEPACACHGFDVGSTCLPAAAAELALALPPTGKA